MTCFRYYHTLLLTLAACAVASANCAAQVDIARGVKSWEFTPYRIEIRVLVEPSALLAPGLEAELQRNLVAQAEANLGGPWIVSSPSQPLPNAGKLQRQLSNLDESAPLETSKDVDKVLVVGVREVRGELQVTAREWDVALNSWNTPVDHTVAQVGRLPAETFAALQAAWGPILRIDAVDKETVTVTLKGGSLPRRDGSFLPLDRQRPFAVFLLPTDKAGVPNQTEIKLAPWTYLSLLSTPGSTAASGTSRASFKCRLHTALGGTPIPEYHPLLQRLAIAKPRSSAPSTLLLVDQEEPHAPLEGYDVFLAPIDATSATVTPQKIGATGRNGKVELPGGDGSLRRLIVSHGGEELARRPYAPGLRSEVRLRLPSNRQRLELAAEVTAAEDEFVDALGRLTILGIRLQDSMAKRDFTNAPRIAQELKSTAAMPSLTNRISALESRLANADEATRSRFTPVLANLKQGMESLQAKISQVP